ncbi:hypothetical protein Mgra_00008587 [Meloidogyne graminicola]|uniref:Regulatory protein zeste n=1 Tax=Meloidogyne graminicola TaxID=189291 RepID=A0A8S9ZFB5_9BILA|nr:hypothetical protein Mgra_00008587 [Meloidogyne graminicola]
MCSHRLAIAKLVRDFKEPLFSHSSQVSRQSKQELWEYIRQQAVNQGASQYAKKSWKEIRDCVWAPIRRDTMAKLNKAKTVGEDSVVFTEIDKIVIEIISTIGLTGWNADDEPVRSPIELFVDNGFNDSSVNGNCGHSDDDFAEIERKPYTSINQMLELIREAPVTTTLTPKYCFDRSQSKTGFTDGDFDQQPMSSTKYLIEDHNQHNIHKRKALDQQFNIRAHSQSPIVGTSSDSDIELEKALKRAKLENLHLQKILLKEQIEEKRLQNQLLHMEIKAKKEK